MYSRCSFEDDQLRASLSAIHWALTADGRFVFETRNPLVRAWESWTPENTIEIVRDGTVVRMAHHVHAPTTGDLVSFTTTYTSPSSDLPQIGRSTLRFPDAEYEPGNHHHR